MRSVQKYVRTLTCHRPSPNSSGRSPLTDERNALLSCNMIGRDRSTQKVGVETEWVDPEINDPEQGDLEIKIMSRSRRK
ncbi:hypothetical protein TNCV_2621281 [Trichonephila clavipes]|uniref:Uncharacterized protein n=1 Tax=Trichonephila clavipes TaxID=2585209 RepID=A0A8X6WDA8_TRICX|nr:hypothetical protein TNCV_2621281 [Trichonephila clavipes]